MPKLRTTEDLKKIQEQVQRDLGIRTETGTRIIVGMGTCGIAAGARETMHAILEELDTRGIDAHVTTVGCIGMCYQEPLVDVEQVGKPRITYTNVHPEMAPRLVEDHLVRGVVAQGGHETVPFYGEIPFYRKQLRILLRSCGTIDPEVIDEYIARDGYQGLAKAVSSMTPQEVYEEVKASGLRGRGGAGFLTGLKWELTARAKADRKYVVCNADEGDPSAFMDR